MGNEIRIRTSKLRTLVTDSERAARAANLKYVSDSDAGIARDKKGDTFVYTNKGEEVSRCGYAAAHPQPGDTTGVERAYGYAAESSPPAGHGPRWPRGHRQYRYHPLWNTLRNFTKFSHMYDFGRALPAIRMQIQKDLSLRGMPMQKVLAAIVDIMQCTNIRIGNNAYEKLYGSFGLTTLKNKHVSVSGSTVKFLFKGKKGVYHDIQLSSRRLANIVRQCREIPGKELFQYYDDSGERHSVDSGMVNDYLKNICSAHFTSKDFRVVWLAECHGSTQRAG